MLWISPKPAPQKQNEESFHKRFVPLLVYLSAVFDSLPISSFSYIVINKKKRKEAFYISIHQCCYFSLLYNTMLGEWKPVYRKSKKDRLDTSIAYW